jgi:hypothetical protein
VAIRSVRKGHLEARERPLWTGQLGERPFGPDRWCATLAVAEVTRCVVWGVAHRLWRFHPLDSRVWQFDPPGGTAWSAGCIAIGCHSGCRCSPCGCRPTSCFGDRREFCQTPSLPRIPKRDRRFLLSRRRPSSSNRPLKRRTVMHRPPSLSTPHPLRPHTAENPSRHRTHTGSRPPGGTRAHRPHLSSRSGSPRPVPRASGRRSPPVRQGTA